MLARVFTWKAKMLACDILMRWYSFKDIILNILPLREHTCHWKCLRILECYNDEKGKRSMQLKPGPFPPILASKTKTKFSEHVCLKKRRACKSKEEKVYRSPSREPEGVNLGRLTFDQQVRGFKSLSSLYLEDESTSWRFVKLDTCRELHWRSQRFLC